MPRAFLKTKNKGGARTYTCTTCRKPIEAGEKYYVWKFRNGGQFFQHAEHGAPRRGQLTNSKMGELYDAVDSFDAHSFDNVDDIKQAMQEVADTARSVGEQYGESADNMEQAFPNGSPTGDACREASDELESYADDLESWDPSFGEYDAEHFESEEEWLDSVRDEATDRVNEHPEYNG